MMKKNDEEDEDEENEEGEDEGNEDESDGIPLCVVCNQPLNFLDNSTFKMPPEAKYVGTLLKNAKVCFKLNNPHIDFYLRNADVLGGLEYFFSVIFDGCGMSRTFGAKKEQRDFTRQIECDKASIERLTNYAYNKNKSPCAVCRNEYGDLRCPDCDKMVGVKCWVDDKGTCKACAAKLASLVKPAAPARQAARPAVAPAPVPAPAATINPFDVKYLTKLRNAVQMSAQFPADRMSQMFGFANADQLLSWLADVGVPGITIDYDKNTVIVTDKAQAIETLNAMIDANMK